MNAAVAELASGLRLSYGRVGGDGLPLVCIPGPTDAWGSYRPVLDAFDGASIAVSMRGHGDSDKPESGYSIEVLAADVVAFLDALAIGRAVLAGHSASCFIARRVAIDHPERVAGLVLEASPTTLRGDIGLEGFVADVVAGLSDPIDRDFLNSWIRDTSTEALDEAVLNELVDDAAKVPTRVWRELFASILVYADLDELVAATAPALLIWGDGDQLVPRAMQDELLQRLPIAELAVYAGVAHSPRWEDPGRFATDAATFVHALTT